MHRLVALLLLALVAACGPGQRQSGGDILVIGDSVMAWNKNSGRDIGAVIGASLDREVISRAASGSDIQAGGAKSLIGLSIPGQLPAGRWNWIVMNGGANDLRGSCGCRRCGAEIDRLISRDAASGAIPNLIARARRQSDRVLWMGYYQATQSSFSGCRPALVELERRVAAYARSNAGVYFVDSESVFDHQDGTLFASDKTHPSPKGSALIGQFLARQIADAERP